MPAVIKPIAQSAIAPWLKACHRIKSLEKKPAVNGAPAIANVAIDVGPVGRRHMRLEPAHLAHVLFAVQSMNDAARAEK